MLPTTRPITQDWGAEFYAFKGQAYPGGFYHSLGWLGHNGIDFGCWTGDEVVAVADGVVEYAGDGNGHQLLTGGGLAVLLRCPSLGIRFEYLHLSALLVAPGQAVAAGQVLARSGATGTATAAHLHLGAIPLSPDLGNGFRGRVNPWPFILGTSLAPQGTITTLEEDDMFTEQDRTVLNAGRLDAETGRKEATNAKVAAREAVAVATDARNEATNAKLAAQDAVRQLARLIVTAGGDAATADEILDGLAERLKA